MATLTSVTNHFPKPKEGFITTLGSSILAGAATVPLNSTSGLTNGDVFVGLIEPGETNEQCFTGIVDTGGNQITGVKWTTGSNVAHTAGVTIVDYVTSTTVGIISKGILVEHNQDGTHSDITADSATITDLTVTNFTIDGTAGADGWAPLGQSLTSVTALGNGSYTAVVSGVDTTGITSVGQRMKIVKSVTAPTQCTSLNGTNQYYSKSSPSGMTFTDDFVVSAWIKVSSYSAGAIASRYNGTSGWDMYMESTGQITIVGRNSGAGNYRGITSYQSVPLNKWVHVAAQNDMSTYTATTTTSYVMFNGVDVPAQLIQAGTNPTTLIQAGNLEIGSKNGGTQPFPGKIAQVAIYSAKVTQATIRASMNQTLTGSETSLVSAYTLSNSLNDLSANANNLTAQGGALATATDTPFTNSVTGTSITAGTTNYGIIMSQTFSTNTTYVVQVPEGETLPTSGGVGTVSYSTQKTPYGFPGDRGKWRITTVMISRLQGSGTATTFQNLGYKMSVPTGAWDLGFSAYGIVVHAGTSFLGLSLALSTTNSSASDADLSALSPLISSSLTEADAHLSRNKLVTLANQIDYYLNIAPTHSSTTVFNQTTNSLNPAGLIFADNAYL